MVIVTLTECDLKTLRNLFSHCDGLNKHFDSIESLTKYLDIDDYKISDYLSIGCGHIDGKRKLFMFGYGYALEQVFGHKRVYGY